jgi:hypothetical protein
LTPEFNTTAQEGGGGGEKNTGREQGQAMRLLKPFTERETNRQKKCSFAEKEKEKGKLCCVSLCSVCCCGVLLVFVAAARR